MGFLAWGFLLVGLAIVAYVILDKRLDFTKKKYKSLHYKYKKLTDIEKRKIEFDVAQSEDFHQDYGNDFFDNESLIRKGNIASNTSILTQNTNVNTNLKYQQEILDIKHIGNTTSAEIDLTEIPNIKITDKLKNDYNRAMAQLDLDNISKDKARTQAIKDAELEKIKIDNIKLENDAIYFNCLERANAKAIQEYSGLEKARWDKVFNLFNEKIDFESKDPKTQAALINLLQSIISGTKNFTEFYDDLMKKQDLKSKVHDNKMKNEKVKSEKYANDKEKKRQDFEDNVS